MTVKPKRVKLHEVKRLYPMPCSIPRWLEEYELLIRTRRRNKYFVVRGTSYGCTWAIDGFKKYKVIGYRELSAKEKIMINNPPIIKGQPIPYQLCPKCNGEGTLRVLPKEDTSNYAIRTENCDLCNGAKVILMYQP